MTLLHESVDQSDLAKVKNRQFFLDNIAAYRQQVENLDTYKNIRDHVTGAVSGGALYVNPGRICDYRIDFAAMCL
jgi:hypothetical protein